MEKALYKCVNSFFMGRVAGGFSGDIRTFSS